MAPAAARRLVADGAVSKETSYESADGGRNAALNRALCDILCECLRGYLLLEW